MAKSCQSIVQDKIGELTECSICAEIFTNPKVLPCVHTFCLHCLENYGKDKQPGSLLVCPICRYEFAIPDGGLCKLPHNFFIGHMVEIQKLSLTPEEKALCNTCPEGEEKVAEMYCVDCEQILCEHCTKYHKKAKHCMNHQVVELGSGLRTQEFKLHNSYCEQHPKELIKMYCHEHSEAICLICCVESHQSHICVNIQKAAGEFTERLKEDRKTVINRLSECKEVVDKLNKYKKVFAEEISKTEENIRDNGTNLKHLIDQHTEVLIQNLKIIRDRNLKAFEVTKEDVDRFTVMIDSFEKYSEGLLSRGSHVDICRDANRMHLRATELEIMPANSNGTTFCCDTVSFYSSDIESSLYQCNSKNFLGELTVTPSAHRIIKFDTGGSDKCESEVPGSREELVGEELVGKPTEESDGKPEEGSRKESTVEEDPCVIEVQGIPDNVADTDLIMIFENKRYTGIEGVELNQIRMLEEGRALLTISNSQFAEALIQKGSIAYKNHTLVISRPSKPESAEEADDASQGSSLHEDTIDTAGINAVAREHLNSDDATIEVSNIPEDMTPETLQMIFENKRYGGGGDVTNIKYEKERGTAVISLSDPEVAKRMVHQEYVIFKESSLKVTRHIEAEKKQKSFPSRKRKTVSVSEEKQPLTSDQTVKVTNIPSDVTKQTLEMIFENKRKGGGETDNIVYDQGQGTAMITFKNAEVAEGLIEKGFVLFKENQLTLEWPLDEGAKENKELTVSSRMVDISEIPPEMTKEMLGMLLENSSGGDVESIDYNPKLNNAVATFTNSVAANDLISKESVVYKGKRLLVTRHLGKVDESKTNPKERKEPSDASNRTIVVSQISEKLSKDYLLMLFENKRNSGGKIEDIDYDPDEGRAVIIFEDPNVAASLLKKEVVEYKGHRMLVTTQPGQVVDATLGSNSYPENSIAKLQTSPISAVSGSFNTIKISGIPQDISKDMISMYFENKRRSGGGKHRLLVYQKEKGKVVVQFNDPKDALEVCKRSHVLCGRTLSISALETPLDDISSCAIEVKGLSEKRFKDM